MKYDFETVIDRRNTGSSKWEQMKNWNPDVGEDIVPFSVADMELKTPPEIVAGLKDYLDSAILGYTIPSEGFNQALVDWMKRRHGWDIDPSWVLGTPGVVTAFFHAVNTYTEPNDGIILMTPVYYPMFMAIERNDRRVVRNPLIYKDNRYTIDFDDLEQKAKDPKTKLLLFCSPHNPVGRVWTKEELVKVGRICIDNNVLILSDEIHFDLVMPGYKHTVFASISEEFAQHSITCTAPSKTFNLAGLQASNNVIPNPDLREQYINHLTRQVATIRLNVLGYKACELAYKYCEPWLEELILLVQKNSQVMTELLAEKLPTVKCIPLEGTYLQWMDFRGFGLDPKELERILHMQAEVFFDEGYIFGDEGAGFERINLACPTRLIIDAVDRMEAALKKYLK